MDHALHPDGVREDQEDRAQFDATLLQPDSTLDEYRDIRAALGKRMTALIEEAEALLLRASAGEVFVYAP